MSEPLDRVTKEMLEFRPGIIMEMGKNVEKLRDAISLNPSYDEVTEALGKESTLSEREAYRQGHQSGWYKGALMFGTAVLAGLAVLTLAFSGEPKKGIEENLSRGLVKRS